MSVGVIVSGGIVKLCRLWSFGCAVQWDDSNEVELLFSRILHIWSSSPSPMFDIEKRDFFMPLVSVLMPTLL